MIEKLAGLPDGVIGLRVGGTLTEKDYDEIIAPLVNDAMRDGGRLRCLIEIERDFSGLKPSALADDVRLGLHSIGAFDGLALVTDLGWAATATKWAAFLTPFPMRVFQPGDREAAIAWLAALPASAAITVSLDESTGVVTAEVTETLRIEDFEKLAATVDPWMHEKGELTGLVLHLRRFPGWANIGSLLRHIQFVLRHQGKVSRIAIVTETASAERLATAVDRIAHPQVRAFGYTDLATAQAWVAGADSRAGTAGG